METNLHSVNKYNMTKMCGKNKNPPKKNLHGLQGALGEVFDTCTTGDRFIWKGKMGSLKLSSLFTERLFKVIPSSSCSVYHK